MVFDVCIVLRASNSERERGFGDLILVDTKVPAEKPEAAVIRAAFEAEAEATAAFNQRNQALTEAEQPVAPHWQTHPMLNVIVQEYGS